MRRLLVALWLALSAAPLHAVTVTALWDSNQDGITTGYRLFYGEMSGQALVSVDVGLTTSVTVPNLVPGVQYFFMIRACNAAGTLGPASLEVAYTVPIIQPPDPCVPPLGATSISIFPTGKLNKTGSGGPGSKAYITFQAASPNSPVTFLAIRANGADVLDSVTEGSNLHAIGSLWFTLPTGPATFAIVARNAANCSRVQSTGFSIAGP